MSSPVDPTAAAPAATASGTPTASAAAPSPTAAATGDVSSIHSLAQLKEQAPAVYKAMMQGIAMQIVDAIKQQEDDLEKLRKEYERESQG